MMMRTVLSVGALSLAVAGCGKPAPTTRPNANAMPGMAMPADAKTGHGTGVIKAIDPVAGQVTLEHKPVMELHWPAMTMGFSGAPTMLTGLAIGDQVDFTFDWDGKVGRLTSIRKR